MRRVTRAAADAGGRPRGGRGRCLRGALAVALAAGLSACSFAKGRGPALPQGEEPELRVAVLTNAGPVGLSSDRAFRVWDARDAARSWPVAAGATVQAAATGGAVELTLPGGEHPTGGPFVAEPAGGGVVAVEGSRYRGSLEVAAGAGGLDVIDRVPLETYLRGVVGNEIGHQEPALFEAVKAQAVAARTYAVTYRGRYAQQGYDLLNTVADQVYTGVEGEAEAVDRAVRATRGVVALYHGEPIYTNYCSTCGGHTAGRDEVWDKPPLPYLSGVSDKGGDGYYCSGSKYFNWQETWSGAEFMDILRKSLARENGTAIDPEAHLTDVRIGERGSSGRVRTIQFRTSRGDFEAHGDRIRWVMQRPDGAGALRSTLFDVSVRRKDGRVSEVRAAGHGWGHGVGMCQWGAMERGRRGQDFAAILKHYYTGIRLAALY